MSGKYIVNPLTGRNIRVGGRIYSDLLRKNVIKTKHFDSDDSDSDDSDDSDSGNSSSSSVYELRRKPIEYVSSSDDDDNININKLTEQDKKYILKAARKIKR